MTAEDDWTVRPAIWSAAKHAAVSIAVIGAGWVWAASQDLIAPISPLGAVAILGAGAWAGIRRLSALLEKQEDDTGKRMLGGAYVRASLVDAILGFVLATAFLVFAGSKMPPHPGASFELVLYCLLGIPFAFAGIVRCAGRRRDRPLLAAIDDAANGGFGGAMAGALACAVYTVNAAADTTQLVIWAALGAAAGAAVNLIRKSAQDRKRLLKSADVRTTR